MMYIDRYFEDIAKRIASDQQYFDRTTKLFNPDAASEATAAATDALIVEQQTINTQQSRSTWRDVKFRSRQKDKVFDIENKTMDSGLQDIPLSPQENFLAKGNHRKTGTVLSG